MPPLRSMTLEVVVPVLAPNTPVEVTRMELCAPVALPPTLTVPVKPVAKEGLRNNAPPPVFSMLPEPDRMPVRLKLPTPAVLTPPKLRKVVAVVPCEIRVPESVSVPLTLVMRLLRGVAGESALTAEVKVPESVLFPMLRMAEERSPKGPRPSKSILRVSAKPATKPSSTKEPPPFPRRPVLDGTKLVVRIEIAEASEPRAVPEEMTNTPAEMVVTPV